MPNGPCIGLMVLILDPGLILILVLLLILILVLVLVLIIFLVLFLILMQTLVLLLLLILILVLVLVLFWSLSWAWSMVLLVPSTDRKKKTKIHPITLGAWNVHTLIDNNQANRPQRRTALVGKELGRYNADIATLSKTRLAEEGQLKERGAGYTFFWSGRASNERREAGVGFAVKNELVSKLSSLPQGVNDRLMTLKLPLSEGMQATIISAYAPTMTNPDDIKDKLYEDLHSLTAAVPKLEKLIILGDFNVRVGTDHKTWENVIGKNGTGNRNSNGPLLLQFCAEHELLITNTVFRLSARNRTSWMHPRSKHWHLIDYVIVRQRDRQDVRVTKSMCGADCWTDHRLITSKMKIRILPSGDPKESQHQSDLMSRN